MGFTVLSGRGESENDEPKKEKTTEQMFNGLNYYGAANGGRTRDLLNHNQAL